MLRRMFQSLDESPWLNRMLQRVSTLLAKQRGLPVVIGIALFVFGFILQVLNLALQSPVVEFLQIILHNVGILIALVGLLLSEPLGR
jgi:hypothetical protein